MDEIKTERFLGVLEIATRIGVSERSIREWATQWQESGGREGIPAFKVGKLWRFDRDEVERWLKTKRISSDGPSKQSL